MEKFEEFLCFPTFNSTSTNVYVVSITSQVFMLDVCIDTYKSWIIQLVAQMWSEWQKSMNNTYNWDERMTIL